MQAQQIQAERAMVTMESSPILFSTSLSCRGRQTVYSLLGYHAHCCAFEGEQMLCKTKVVGAPPPKTLPLSAPRSSAACAAHLRGAPPAVPPRWGPTVGGVEGWQGKGEIVAAQQTREAGFSQLLCAAVERRSADRLPSRPQPSAPSCLPCPALPCPAKLRKLLRTLMGGAASTRSHRASSRW